MKNLLHLTLVVFMATFLFSCNSSQKVELFNGEDLSKWTKFVEGDEADPDETFRVEDGLIHVSGVPNGYIRTKEVYSNYKLHVEWRWVEEPANSGIFIHCSGEDKIWPSVIECQLAHSKAGDLVFLNSKGTVNGEPCRPHPRNENISFCTKFEESSEKPAGEWNEADITCRDNTFEFVINGVLQMKGSAEGKSEGNICLQSEGGPIQFRNVYLEKLD